MPDLATVTTDELIWELCRRSGAAAVAMQPKVSERHRFVLWRFHGNAYTLIGLVSQMLADLRSQVRRSLVVWNPEEE